MSTNARIYLDFNATAPLLPEARAAMTAAMDVLGNPSSIHAEGRAARDLVERARNQVAALVGRPREQVVFTSGGTEANVLGVLGLAAVVEKRGGPRVVVTTAIEHPSLAGAVASLRERGWEVRTIDPRIPLADPVHPIYDAGCRPEALEPIAGAGLVALALVNHEVGTFAALAHVLAKARAAGALVHVDAVQAVGKLGLAAFAADAIAISAHKIGGPQGVGALAISVDEALPIVDAGHHERGRRAGTENTIGVVGFGAAATTADIDKDVITAIGNLGFQLASGVERIAGARIHAADFVRVANTLNVGFAGALGESIVVALDLAGIAVSTGAACTSGSIQPSAVLLGLGYSPEQAREAVRFSLGRSTTQAEIERVLEVLPPIVERARRHRT